MRDYGRHDLSQLRIKKDRLLDPEVPNLYIRGDGTRVYYFEKEDLRSLLTETASNGDGRESKPMFEVVQLEEDRRMVRAREPRLAPLKADHAHRSSIASCACKCSEYGCRSRRGSYEGGI